MDYLKLLERGFEEMKTWEGEAESRLQYLADYIFDFTTYDGEMAELFGRKAVEVCAAISDGKTFDYIKDAENYKWYLLMVNMPFFCDRLSWGGSIRGAWWDHKDFDFTSCGLYDGDEQVVDLKFSHDEWVEFVKAIVEFASFDQKGASHE